MEILIVGGIVVLLMAAASTKIKQAAARAFEPEIVEREDFTVNKPEGFLTPLNDVSGYEFEARSREYGEKKTKNVWRARAVLTASDGLNLEAEREEAKRSADKITSERVLENDERKDKICLLEIEGKRDDIQTVEFCKIVESRARQKTYVLQISVLPQFRADYLERVNEMTNSFRLK